MKLHFTVLALLVLAACSIKPQAIPPPKHATGTPSHRLYVVNHGWHTGFIITAEGLFDALPWLQKRFPSTSYLEFGWGDEDFYQARKMTTALTLKAAFWPTASVMRVAAELRSPQLDGTAGEIRLICLTDPSYQSFIAFLQRSFARDAAGHIVEGNRGLYGNSQFYRAVGQYSLFNTCNTWTAKGLQSAGIAISPTFKITASSIMKVLEMRRTCQAQAGSHKGHEMTE